MSMLDMSDMKNIQALEDIIHYNFENKALLLRAITRSDAVTSNEVFHDYGDQNAYATLGDAILSAILAVKFFQSEESTPHSITIHRASIEARDPLYLISGDMDIGNYLIMSKNEYANRFHLQPRALAESLEAIIGAIYLDSYFEKTKEVVFSWEEFQKFFDGIEGK
jgi:ribonuclease-3